MPTIPTVGVFIPNALNNCNSPGPTGQQDFTGAINYPSGLTTGKVIELSENEAQYLQLGSPSVQQLFEGAYQWVQVDSGATASECRAGLAAFQKLPIGAPTTARTSVVTGQSGAQNANLFAGVFINPNGITPGNWGFIFVGQGRVNVNFKNPLTNSGAAVGDVVEVTASGGLFDDTSATAVTSKTIGFAADYVPVSGGTSPIWIRDLIARITPTAPGT